jgi:hypothetical protein
MKMATQAVLAVMQGIVPGVVRSEKRGQDIGDRRSEIGKGNFVIPISHILSPISFVLYPHSSLLNPRYDGYLKPF